MRGLLYLVVLCSAGCQQQPALGVVTGRVTCGEKSVSGANIVFQKEDGSWSVFAELDDNGNYKIQTHDAAGLVPGKYLVAVRPARAVKDNEPLISNEKPLEHPLVAERFHSHTTSNLIAVVKEGTNSEFNFNLATKE